MKRRLPSLPRPPKASTLATQASMKGNRSKGTSPEKKLAQLLDSRGLKSYIMHDRMMPGSPDFIFPNEKLAIFVNGCYWHRCPYCRPNFPKSNVNYWTAKFQRNRQRDVENRSDLRAMGWRPMVVWECVLRRSSTRVAARIRRKLEESRG